MAQTSLPPGFRFHPTDIELCAYYLKRKIMGKKLIVDAIAEVELYKFAPWDLPDKACLRSRDLEWFFFCPRDKKYPNGSRTNRATPNGYWKTSGKDRTIMLDSRIVGSKKTLIFHQGKAPKGDRTDWVMYEYKMEDDSLVSTGFSKDAYVLCKIFKKSGLGPRIGEQYGAPFNEAEWENAENETSMFHLMPSSEVVNPVDDPHAQQAVAAGTMEELIGEHPSAVCAMDESSFGTAANTCIEDMTFNNAVAGSDIQEGMVSENIVSNEVHNLYDPPEFDGFLLEELSNFLNDSPLRDNAFGENPVLPPMSDAEAHAFEVNTLDLYNELAAISGLGDVPSNFNTGLGDVPSNFNTGFGDVPSNFNTGFGDVSSNFNTGYDGTMGHITLPADRYLSNDEFLELNDIVGPEFDAEFPAQNNQLYPYTQYTYSGNYNDLTAPPASSEASGSLAMMPNRFDMVPPANNGSFATYQDSHSSGPGM